MVLGIERINARQRPPNPYINFLAPLPGASSHISNDYLSRIAAIVYPIMKNNHLSVMTLDEFPPNTEFWGRNFDFGACIQLVLRHPSTNRYLPFSFVLGVMIHELAHIKEMNHGPAFWKVRGAFAQEMAELRRKAYTGEGFWSRGRRLTEGDDYAADHPLARGGLPEQVCGGTYRQRNRRRVPKAKPNYQERKRRRIEKKFGARGEKVGGDEEVRRVLEEASGKRPGASAPRVAGSQRGRELRAAAALKRLEAQQEIKGEEEEEDEETESEWEDAEDGKAVDVGGGKFLVPVSREEDGTKEKEDMDQELRDLMVGYASCSDGAEIFNGEKDASMKKPSASRTEGEKCSMSSSAVTTPHPPNVRKESQESSPQPQLTSPEGPKTRICSVCSVENAPHAVACEVCMNVLGQACTNAWRCASKSCPPGYRNSADVAFCGICGGRR
jgi:hypothetical protein